MNCDGLRAVVIGCGPVGARKARSLAECGASVRVIAPVLSSDFTAHERIDVEMREYRGQSDLADFDIVVAATDSNDVNDRIAADARSLHRLVNVVTDGAKGSFATMAIHRAGSLLIGVRAGGVPSAAMRIRDAIAERFDERYARALGELAMLRETGSDWKSIDDRIDSQFCERVERGDLHEVTR